MCELSLVPYDAPNADMVTDQLWHHYAIAPWATDVSVSVIRITISEAQLRKIKQQFRLEGGTLQK